MPKRSLCRGEQLCFLAHRDSTVRSSGNLERKWSLSLSKISSFLSLSFSLSNFPPKPFGRRDESRLGPHTCHMSTFHWLIGFPYPLYPSTLDFHPMTSCHVSTHGPHLSSCLTNFAHDMWHSMSLSKCVNVSHPSRYLEKREIPTFSEFDEI